MCECPSNITTSLPSNLLLLGLSWIQDKALWMSIPLVFTYLVECLANCTLVVIIILERSLHKPMYIYIAVLGLVDFALSACVIPKVLAILWFDAHTISAEACLLQMILFYSLESVELSLLTLMSFDRYVAICQPLRYPSIITSSFTIKSLFFFITRNVVLISPLSYFTTRLQYCKSNAVPNTFCEHLSVIKLACGDITPNTIYIAALVCMHTVTDFILIGISYLLILRVVLRLGSSEARKKAFSTCSSHITVFMFFVLSSTFSFLVYMFDSNAPLYMQTMSTILITLIPPMMNPIVYGVKTQEIRQGVKKLALRIQRWQM